VSKTLTVLLALISGLAGSILSRYIAPPAAFAQTTKEIQAQRVTLVDASGTPIGTFTTRPWLTPSTGGKKPETSTIVVLNGPDGRLLWRPNENADGAKFRNLNLP